MGCSRGGLVIRRSWLICAIMLSIFSLSVSALSFDPQDSPFSMPVGAVVLDAGHGGHDPGASATYAWYGSEPIEEKEIVLDIMMQAAAFLRGKYPDITVTTTRSDDRFVSLEERSAIAARTDPGVGHTTIFISIHANSSLGNGVSGIELLIKPTDKRVYFLGDQSPNWALARFANHTGNELNQLLNRQNILLASHVKEAILRSFPTARDRGIKEQDVWVLNASTVPSVLVEIGFISNENEARLMMDPNWRTQMAQAIADGIGVHISRD